MCCGFQRGSKIPPEEHHVTKLLSAPNSHMQDEGGDFGLAGVSSEVGTDNVLIASFFGLSLSQAS